jgi:hypothetical protein
MTILPYKTHFSRWQRAKIRAEALVRDFKHWCAAGNATMPDWWSPEKAKKEYTEILSEMEKVMSDHEEGS